MTVVRALKLLQYFNNILFREYCTGVAFTSADAVTTPPSFHHVLCIVRVRSQSQMVGVTASGVIAGV